MKSALKRDLNNLGIGPGWAGGCYNNTPFASVFPFFVLYSEKEEADRGEHFNYSFLSDKRFE